MDNVCAILIRARLKATEGWDDLADAFPIFPLAIDLLPDESKIASCNVMLREIYEDVKRWAIDCQQESDEK